MSLSMQDVSVGTFAPTLRTLSGLLDRASEFAAAQGISEETLANARLAPDMFPLKQQIQVACDQAKSGVARLAGVEAPVFEDNEETLAALKDRIDRTVAFIESVPAAAFEGAETRAIVIPIPGDLEFHMTGFQAIRDWSLPHFYFHVVTAYDILRAQGAPIGKRDYLAHIAHYVRPAAA